MPKETAPASDLVLAVSPLRTPAALGDERMSEGHHFLRVARQQHSVALRALAVQVKGDIGALDGALERRQRLRVDHGVDGPRQRCDCLQRRRRAKDLSVVGEVLRDRPERRYRGEEVAEAQRPEGHQQGPRAAPVAARAAGRDGPSWAGTGGRRTTP